MAKVTFTNSSSKPIELLEYKSYKKRIIPASEAGVDGVLELTVGDVVVVAEEDAIEYYENTYDGIDGLTVTDDVASSGQGT